MSDELEELRARLRETHAALDNLLCVFVLRFGADYNAVDAAYEALATNLETMSDLSTGLPVWAEIARRRERKSQG